MLYRNTRHGRIGIRPCHRPQTGRFDRVDRTLVVPQGTFELHRHPERPRSTLRAWDAADAYALRHRFHDAAMHNRYMPQGAMARDLYDAMETARCEAVGARAMPGVGDNLDAKLTDQATKRGYSEISTMSEAPVAEAAALMLRQRATGRDIPAGAAQLYDLWKEGLEGMADESIDGLVDALDDQVAFAKAARQVIEDLGYGEFVARDETTKGFVSQVLRPGRYAINAAGLTTIINWYDQLRSCRRRVI